MFIFFKESKDDYLSPISHFKQPFLAHTEVMGNLETHPGKYNSYIVKAQNVI
jgi:hypothetical protein